MPEKTYTYNDLNPVVKERLKYDHRKLFAIYLYEELEKLLTYEELSYFLSLWFRDEQINQIEFISKQTCLRLDFEIVLNGFKFHVYVSTDTFYDYRLKPERPTVEFKSFKSKQNNSNVWMEVNLEKNSKRVIEIIYDELFNHINYLIAQRTYTLNESEIWEQLFKDMKFYQNGEIV